MLPGIQDADYFLQNEFVLRNGTSIIETAPSYRLMSFEKVDAQTTERTFRGCELYVVVCASIGRLVSLMLRFNNSLRRCQTLEKSQSCYWKTSKMIQESF